MRVVSQNQLFLLLCALGLPGVPALAQDRPEPPRPKPSEGAQAPQRQPGEAAITACADLKPDDVCEVELRDRTIQGKCVPAGAEAKLLCQPDNSPEAPR